MGPGFWAAIGFCLLCLVAAVGVTIFGPQLFPHRSNPVANGISGIFQPQHLAIPTPTGASPSPDKTGDILNAQTEALAVDHARAATAARAALVAAGLSQSTQSSQPFLEQWSQLDALTPGDPDIAALRPLAVTGAPSHAALALAYGDYAARAATAARMAGPGAGLWDRVRSTLSRVVMVRRVDNPKSNDVDGVLAHAEGQLREADLERALKTLEALPSDARLALSPWLIQARSRAELDHRVAALREKAQQRLDSLSGSVG